MIILSCEKCGKKQSQGRFCLDCGGRLKEMVASGFKFKKFETNKYSDQLKNDIKTWLMRVGVQESDIVFNSDGRFAEVSYTLNGNNYKFTSVYQKDFRNNLAAIEQLIHYRVLGIEKGVEDAQQAFAGYEALPNYSVEGAFDGLNSLQEVEEKWKNLVKKHHPDMGGDPENFRKLKEEFDRARARFS